MSRKTNNPFARHLHSAKGKGKKDKRAFSYPDLPLLSADEELALARRARAGDREAFDRMVLCNMRLVISLAVRRASEALPLDDLVQYGALGLMTAVERFDPERGFRFTTYAVWWIAQAIGRAIENHRSLVRVPNNVFGLYRKDVRAIVALKFQLGRMPTPAEIAEATGMSEERFRAMRLIEDLILSIDYHDEAHRREGLLFRSERKIADPSEVAATKDQLALLDWFMIGLDKRDAEVLRMRFGIGGYPEMKLNEIGEILGVSGERVRQLEDRALSSLRDAFATSAARRYEIRRAQA